MIDIKRIQSDSQSIKIAAKHKGIVIDVDHILKIDETRSTLQKMVQSLQEERNSFAKNIQGKPTPEQITVGKEIKNKLEKEEAALKAVKEELDMLLLQIPNPAKPDVKAGKDDTENDVIRTYKEPTQFSFTPKDHLELGEKLGIIDMERAAKVSGARFAYLKGDAVLLEFALFQFALETLIKEGFTPIIPPVLIKQRITQGLGYWQQGGNEDYYLVYDPRCRKCETEVTLSDITCPKCENKLDNEEHALYLIGTAEHSLVPMHADEVLNKKELPKRYVGFSSAFRREAGSYGKDTRGILRVHQFDKVEMVSFVAQGKDDEEHEYLLSLEEKMFQLLDIPYRVIKMCTGDLGFPAARKYDIEAWMPGQQAYREVTSASTVTDFQSRRLKIRYRDGEKTEYTFILNGTAFAIGRTLIAILENYQQEDGSILVPEVLRKYMGKDVIKPQK